MGTPKFNLLIYLKTKNSCIKKQKLKMIEKENIKKYPVMEHFYTVQGEGFWTGVAAYFVRLGGCDVGCHWCDVKESWPMDAHPLMSVQEIVDDILKTKAQRVVITGGEPLMHDLNPLTQLFHTHNIKTHIETSGAHSYSGTLDWICLSPKKFKPALPEIYKLANELKIIVFNKHDLEWAESEAAKVNENTLLYLQPEWSKKESNDWIVEYVKENPKWRISLQTHKYLMIP